MRLTEIIGHKNNIKQIINVIEHNNLSHAHLIVGEDGIGKSLMANGIALKILGAEGREDHIDLAEWKIGKNKKTIGVGEIRDLIEEITKRPYEGDNKVIIVHNSEKMTIQAQNAFLKTIEEPPNGVYIILLCENLEAILDTIKSRCQIHKLKALTIQEIKEFIYMRYGNLPDEKIRVLTSFSNGIPGRVEKFIEDKDFNFIRDKILTLLKEKASDNDILKYTDFFIEIKDKWSEALNCILSYLRDMVVIMETADVCLIINTDKVDEIKELANMFSFSKIISIIKIINDTRNNIEKNLNNNLAFEVMLLKIQEV